MQQVKLGFGVILIMLLSADCSPHYFAGEVPFVPTPPEVIDRMLELARVTKDDIIYDLGSGDGRILIQAAKKYGVRGVGIEIDPDLVRRSQIRAQAEGVDRLIEFRAQDALAADVSPATVVTLYMLPEFNAKLRPILDHQLRPGTRVVSHDFDIEGWTPQYVEKVRGGPLHDHILYLFTVGEGRR